MRRRVLVLLAATIMALVGMQAAFAAVSSSISIAYNHTTERFHGNVTSSNHECQAGRTVRLFKQTTNGPSLEGKTLSKSDGTWRIEVMHAHGHYYAVTPQQQIMHTTCGRAKSKTVDVM